MKSKTNFGKCVRRSFFAALLVLVCAGSAMAGNDRGNGGDEIALDFMAKAMEIADFLDMNMRVAPEVDRGELRTLLESTVIESTEDPLILDGVGKDAINYPAEKRILVNRGRWLKIETHRRKLALVFHELLGLMALNDSNYQISSRVFSALPNPNDELRFFIGQIVNRLSWLLSEMAVPTARPQAICYSLGALDAEIHRFASFYAENASEIDIDQDRPIEERRPWRAGSFRSSLTRSCNGQGRLEELEGARDEFAREMRLLLEIDTNLEAQKTQFPILGGQP